MTCVRRVLIVIFCLFLFPSGVLGAKMILTVRIWLLQGTPNMAQPEYRQTEVLPVSSTPEFARLKILSGGSDNDLKAALIETLLETQDLRSLDDLFFFKQSQREDLPFPAQVVLGRQLAFRIGLSHKVLSPAQVALRVTLSRTKDGILRPEKDDRTMLRNVYQASLDEDKMAVIVDQPLAVEFDDPVVIRIPDESHPYFLIVKLTAGEPEARRKATPVLKTPSLPKLAPAPRPVDKVLPSYPEELRRRGLGGEVGLRIVIDEQGTVRMVQVLSSLHPYLDYAASQAFWQWRFEPVLQGNKPIPAAFDYMFAFDPRTYAEEAAFIEEDTLAGDATARQELEDILSACAAYCRKLRDRALFYTCEETIKETTHALVPSDHLAELSLRAGDTAVQVYEDAAGREGWLVEKPNIMSIRNIDRLSYSCDYQMIRRFGEIEERRIVLKESGRKITNRVELLEESRYTALSPIVSALGLLAEDRQPLFHYRIVKEDKVFGRNALIIEAVPRLGDADGVRSARAWLEKGSGRILKCEIEGVPLAGYDDVLGEAVLLNIRPHFMRTYEYRTENSGVLLPDRTAVRIEYPSLMLNRRETKSKIDISYKDFRFFTVETGHDIKEER